MRLKEQRNKEEQDKITKKKAIKDAKKQRKLERRKTRAAEEGEGENKVDAINNVISSSEDE